MENLKPSLTYLLVFLLWGVAEAQARSPRITPITNYYKTGDSVSFNQDIHLSPGKTKTVLTPYPDTYEGLIVCDLYFNQSNEPRVIRAGRKMKIKAVNHFFQESIATGFFVFHALSNQVRIELDNTSNLKIVCHRVGQNTRASSVNSLSLPTPSEIQDVLMETLVMPEQILDQQNGPIEI